MPQFENFLIFFLNFMWFFSYTVEYVEIKENRRTHREIIATIMGNMVVGLYSAYSRMPGIYVSHFKKKK